MNQDIDDVHGRSNECGNPFSSCHEKVVDTVQVKVEDESCNFYNYPSQHDKNSGCIVHSLGENKECGKPFTKDDWDDENGMIDPNKIKVEDRVDYFDIPPVDNHITAYIDKPSSSERILTIDGMETPIIEPVEIKIEEQIISCNNHIANKKGRSKRYECEVCARRVTSPSALRIHMRTHTGEKPFKCEVCGKSFSQKHHLEYHTKTHTGNKPFNCEVCGKSFILNKDLISHTRIHTGETPFKCQFCDRKFKLKQYLNYHMIDHTGERPFKCELCGRRFKSSPELTLHTRIHTGEKPFKCEVCGKAFRSNSILKTHIRIHSDEKPFKCEVCGKGFAQSINCNNHIKKQHSFYSFRKFIWSKH